jgi:NAD(P)-dependent dehydrogenase (short-subunit alcohol dehydrogenase family)
MFALQASLTGVFDKHFSLQPIIRSNPYSTNNKTEETGAMSTDLFGLKGKTAVVWGGGFGMGEATCNFLAAVGCNVAVVDLELERATSVATRLQATGIRTTAIATDVTDEPAVADAVRAIEAALGPIDVMVTVIGIGVWAKLVDMTAEQWSESHRLNLTSFFYPAKAVARAMIKNVSGLTSAPNHGGYGAAKAGMVNLVRTMALEWGPHNIRVNCVAPGAVLTPRLASSMGSMLEMMKERVPLGRPAVPDDIAKAALFLVSDLASYITGQTLPVEGGWLSTYLIPTSGRT